MIEIPVEPSELNRILVPTRDVSDFFEITVQLHLEVFRKIAVNELVVVTDGVRRAVAKVIHVTTYGPFNSVFIEKPSVTSHDS